MFIVLVIDGMGNLRNLWRGCRGTDKDNCQRRMAGWNVYEPTPAQKIQNGKQQFHSITCC